MKNTAFKALGISFGFHLLMALLATWVLSLTHPPMEEIRIPIKSMSLVSMNEPAPISLPAPAVTIPSTAKPLTAKTLTVQPAIPQPPIIQARPAPTQTATVASAVAAPLIVAASETPPTAAEAKASTPPVSVKERQKADLGAELQAFKTALRAKIQQNLRYPSAARRRGMEGEVDIHFVVENSGIVRDINVRRGEGIFHDAARLAVASASGIRIPDSLSASFPEELAITLEFRLN